MTSPDHPLQQALEWSRVLGFPARVWAAIATALAPDDVTYTPADAEAFCEQHPELVTRTQHRSGDHYARPLDAARESLDLMNDEFLRRHPEIDRQNEAQDAIAEALVDLLHRPAVDEPGVRDFLQRRLPELCARGKQRGMNALRAVQQEADVDRGFVRDLLSMALEHRSDGESTESQLAMRREAVDLSEGQGLSEDTAKGHARLAAALRDAGDIEGAVDEMDIAAAQFEELAMAAPLYRRWLALTLLNHGILCSEAGRRGAAVRSMKSAVIEFTRLADSDHRFDSELRLATQELRRVRWRRRTKAPGLFAPDI